MDSEDAKDLERYIKDKRRAEAKCKLSEVAQLCNCIGEVYSKYGRFEDAIQEHNQERTISETLGDRIGEAVACRKIGENLCSQGLYRGALEMQKQHLTIARECNNHIEEQRAWATIGRTYLSQAETRNIPESLVANRKAEKAFVKALEACDKIKASVKLSEYMSMKGRIYLNMGLVYELRSDLKESAEMMKRAVVIAEKFKLDEETYLCHSSLASLYQKGNQNSQALRSLGVALTVAEKLRNKVWERETYILKASVHANNADYLAAKHCLKRAHKLKIDSDTCEGKVVKMFQCVNKLQEASQDLQNTTSQDLQNTTSQKERARLYEIMADSATELANFTQAIEYYLKVLEFSTVMSSDERADIYVSLAQSYADIREYDSAIFYYHKELEERKDDSEQACRTFLNIAELKELQGSPYSVACKIYMSAFEAAKKGQHIKLQIQTLKSLIVLQQTWKQTIHLEETKRKLSSLLQKKSLQDGCESDSEEEAEGTHGAVSNKEDHNEDLSLSDLTVSEESDCDHGPTRAESRKRSVRRNEKGETGLHRACIDGNLKKVKSLIGEGHPVNTRDFCGWLPLHEACNHGYGDVVEYLVSAGAWINDRGGDRCGGVTPLIDAANCGHLQIVELLVDRGAQVRARDDDGNTALDSLRSWYSRTEDVLSLADEIQYKKIEKLLQNLMGGDASPTPGARVGQSQAIPSLFTRKADAARPRDPGSSRLPDICCDDNQTRSKSGDHKQQRNAANARLLKLKQRRECRLSSRSTQRLPEAPESITSSDDEPSDIFRDAPFSPSKHEPKLPYSEVYRLVINSVGQSGQKRSEVDPKSSDVREDTASVVTRLMPALVDADEDVGDEWLVNDIEWPQHKRKSSAISNVLTTSSSRSSARKRPRRDETKSSRNMQYSSSGSNRYKGSQSHIERHKARICRSRLDSDEEEEENHDNGCPVSSSSETVGSSNKLKKSVAESSSEHVWDSDDEMLCQIDTSYDGDSRFNTACPQPGGIMSYSHEINVGADQRQSSAASDRLNLDLRSGSTHTALSDRLNMDLRSGLTRTVQTLAPSDRLNTDLRSGSTRTVQTLDTSAGSKLSTSEACPIPPIVEIFEKPTYKNSIRVRVQVGGQTLLLPIPLSDQEKSVAWLCQQVRERYFSMFLLLPTLTLSTQDGTNLCPSDTISMVIQDIDLLTANVIAYERPKLEDRYAQACKLCLTSSNTHILSLLQKADQSGQLVLSDMALGLSLLQPVFQALDDHKILTALKLNGNRLGDAGIGSLMKLLTGLPHLKVLSLETNGISAEGVQTMGRALKSELCCLQFLSTLSLSHNCLDDMAAESLASVVRSLPKLTHLCLCSCHFSHVVFSASFCEALQELRLEHLDFSENNIGDEGLKCLLMAVHSDCLRELYISHTRCKSEQDICPRLQDLVNHGECCLQELSLAGNHLSPVDVAFINRLPVLVRSVRSLVLSQNQNINNRSLQKLLYLSADKSSELDEITARGCSIASPIEPELLEAMRSKMSGPNPLRKFVFTCRGLKAGDSEALTDIWINTWKDQGQVKVEGMTVSLTVV